MQDRRDPMAGLVSVCRKGGRQLYSPEAKQALEQACLEPAVSLARIALDLSSVYPNHDPRKAGDDFIFSKSCEQVRARFVTRRPGRIR